MTIEVDTNIQKDDRTIDVHLRSLNKKDFDELNYLRRQRKFTWAELFKHLNVYRSQLTTLLNRETEPSVCNVKSVQTISSLLPKWCENIAINMNEILSNGDISYIVCKTRGENKCHKIDKLREMIFDPEHTYDVKDIAAECKFPLRYMDYLIRRVYTTNFVSIAGSGLCMDCENSTTNPGNLPEKRALIIGGGPSLKMYDHLKILKKYGFNGDIFVVGKVLKEVLECGIIPKYVGALDAEEFDTTFFDHDIVDKYSDQITGLFGTTIHPTTTKRWKGKRYYFTGYIGEEEAANISHVVHLMTKTSVLSVSGNIGSCMANIATFLGYNKLVLIGMDLSFPTFNSMKEYYPNAPKDSWNQTLVYNGKERPMYKRQYNPYFKKPYYMDSVFEAYKLAHLSWAKILHEEGFYTINCSEQGSLHGKYIHSMKFEDYLKNQDSIPWFMPSKKLCLSFWKEMVNNIPASTPISYLYKSTDSARLIVDTWKDHVSKSDKIIELGCNSGRNINYLYNNGYKNITGIDINRKAIQTMKKELPEIYKKCKPKTSEIGHFLNKLKDNENDVTFTIGVLQAIHPNNSMNIFKNIVRTTSKYIVIIEKETDLQRNISFERNYKQIFESFNCETITDIIINEDMCNDHEIKGYKLYVFKKN